MSTDTATPEFATLREKIAWEKEQRAARYAEFDRIFREAQYEGALAGNAVSPTPMIVGSPSTPLGTDVDPTKPMEVVPEGVCGFAWVSIRPGNSSFARWLVKNGHARPAYRGGVQIWIGAHGQSYERKVAHAQTLALHLNKHESLGRLMIFAGSRLD